MITVNTVNKTGAARPVFHVLSGKHDAHIAANMCSKYCIIQRIISVLMQIVLSGRLSMYLYVVSSAISCEFFFLVQLEKINIRIEFFTLPKNVTKK